MYKHIIMVITLLLLLIIVFPVLVTVITFSVTELIYFLNSTLTHGA